MKPILSSGRLCRISLLGDKNGTQDWTNDSPRAKHKACPNLRWSRPGNPETQYVRKSFMVGCGTRPSFHSQHSTPTSCQLLVLSTLGRRFYGLGEGLGVFCAMNPPVQHIIPCDVGIEMVCLGLFFEFGLQLSQLLWLLLRQINPLSGVIIQIVEFPSVFIKRQFAGGISGDKGVRVR